jgi:phosphomevalonate kinase
MKGLNFKESLSASEYKESFRQEMITWSEQVRREDPNIFLRSAIHDECAHDFPIWVLVDARRACDLQFFKDEYPDNEYRKTFTVRIVSSEETRKKRGWSFQSGVDDVESECGLDHVSHWSIIVKNEEGTTDSMLEEQVRAVIKAASAVTATHDP